MSTLDKLFERALNLVTTWWPYPGNAQDQVSKLRKEYKKAKNDEIEKQKYCPYCHKFNNSYATWDSQSGKTVYIYLGHKLVEGDFEDTKMAKTSDGRIGLYVAGDGDGWHEINYCPICGRHLGE